MKKSLILTTFMALSAMAEDSIKETITLTSTSITAETFTETEPDNGLFYSDATGSAFFGSGTSSYTITADNDTNSTDDDISLSKGSGTAVSVGTFTGESHLIIGSASAPIRVYTESSMFIGGYGWHTNDNTGKWNLNASLSSNKTRPNTFSANKGSITVYKDSTLEVGTGLGDDFKTLAGAQLYIGHGAAGTLTVDGGTVISHAYIGVSTNNIGTTNNDGTLNIQNGGKVYIKAEPQEMVPLNGENYSYNQLQIGNNNVGKGSVLVSGENSYLELESSTYNDSLGNPFNTIASIGRNGGTGELIITDKAIATIGTAPLSATTTYVGYGTGSNGSISVSNDGQANLNGSLFVGDTNGSGELRISSGGTITQTNGFFYIGSNQGTGKVYVENDGTLISQSNVLVGYTDGQNNLLQIDKDGQNNLLQIEEGGSAEIYGILDLTTATSAATAGTLQNEGSLSVGSYININQYNQVTNRGNITTASHIYLAKDASLDNSGSITANETLHLYKGCNLTNTGNIQANAINIRSENEITNDGIMTATSKNTNAINLGEGAAIRNNGTLGGNIEGNGVIDGNGNMTSVTIGKSTKLVVGETITGLQVKDSITLGSGSTTVFNIAGLNLAEVGSDNDWDSGTHSVIKVDDRAEAFVNKGAAFELMFGGDEIWNNMTMEGNTIIWDFTLTLIEGGVTAGSIDLDALLDNTTFSLTTDASDATGLSSINVTNAHYKITADRDLILTGSIAIPEPTTATLSLLALASLAARRRRKYQS